MYYGTRRTSTYRWPLALVLVAAAAAFYAWRPAGSTGEAATPAPQDLIRLESRLGQLEQRFYTVESSIRGLEQQVRLSSAAPRSAARERDPEVGLLRSEVEALRLRLAEAECGLLRVDERTLTPGAREARRKAAAGAADPCRLNTDAPLRLAARP
jgi:hypothetical protein